MFAAAERNENAMFVSSWTGGWDPSNYVDMLFHTGRSHTPNGSNVGHYSSETVDEYIDAGLTETDHEDRVEIYQNLQEELVADSPASFVRFREATHVWDAMSSVAGRRTRFGRGRTTRYTRPGPASTPNSRRGRVRRRPRERCHELRSRHDNRDRLQSGDGAALRATRRRRLRRRDSTDARHRLGANR